MDFYENGAICTKMRFWKQKQIILNIIDFLQQKNYQFKELVFGEPNDFVFTEAYDQIIPTLKRKGGYIGVRIKLITSSGILEISSNTNGINNVKYDIFAETETELTRMKQDVLALEELIKPSNNGLSIVNEYLVNNPNITKIIIASLVLIALYFLGVYVFLFSIVRLLFSISPFLFIFIVYLILSNRRR